MNPLGVITVGEYSPLGIFLSADSVVKAVVIALIATSIASWAIIVSRSVAVMIEGKKARDVFSALTFVKNVEELDALCSSNTGSASRILEPVSAEWRWSIESRLKNYEQLRNRIFSVVDMAIAREGKRAAGQSSLLATIGSTAPFVGLFGTVWGIMHSFISIGQTQDTSLAVVAPGIAEALMATAIGLFCAIPAVVGYNRLLKALGQLETDWRSTASVLEVAISRNFDLKGQ